jgi:hypothetical protein
MAEPSPSTLKSLVNPPASINDAVGYRVEVKSHLPHAEEGDYFQGNIIIISSSLSVIIIIIIINLGHIKSVNPKNANVIVSFDHYDDDGQSSDLVLLI